MNVTVNLSLAEKKLKEVIDDILQGAYVPSSKCSDEIKQIILGEHKTYRYMLITAALAKAVNPNINALALQAKSTLIGAYDARSLCHKVLVPIERAHLNNRIGGSNEPFLNKPARFAEISLSNSVRAGSDSILLGLLHSICTQLNSNNNPDIFLKDCIYYVFERESSQLSLSPQQQTNGIINIEILNLARNILSANCLGECAAIITYLAYRLEHYTEKHVIKAHKVNQSGASSNEVLDIDIYLDNELSLSIEVKDKPFTYEDVLHAAHKAASGGLSKFLFIKGPSGYLTNAKEDDVISDIAAQGIYVIFLDVLDLLKIVLFNIEFDIDKSLILKILSDAVASMKIRDNTFNHLKNCLTVF